MAPVNNCWTVPVLGGIPLMSHLRTGRLNVPFPDSYPLFRNRPSSNSTGSIEAGSAVRYYPVSPLDIGITNDCAANIGNRGVIIEGVAFPTSAIVSDTTVTEAVVNSAIEPDMWSPIASVPDVTAL